MLEACHPCMYLRMLFSDSIRVELFTGSPHRPLHGLSAAECPTVVATCAQEFIGQAHVRSDVC